MFCNFKKGSSVIIHGSGKNEGKFYKNVIATIIEKDPFFKDYHVRLKNGTEDWFEEECLKKYIHKNAKGVKS